MAGRLTIRPESPTTGYSTVSSRRRIQDATGVDTTVPRYGHIQAWGAGPPVSGLPDYAPGCIYHNVAGTPGTCFYLNVGHKVSSDGLPGDAQIGADFYAPVPCRSIVTCDLTSLGAKYFHVGVISAG